MGRVGSAFVAANSVTTVVQQLSSVLTQGISNASGIITGHTMGQGNYEKAQKQGYTFLALGTIIGLVAGIFILCIKNPVINYYSISEEADKSFVFCGASAKSISEEAKEIAHSLMIAVSLIMVFQSANSILTKGVLRAGGDTKFLMAGDILFLWVASIPLGILAGLVFHWSSFWIYTMLKIDQIIKCIWCYFRLRSGKWMKKINSSIKEG